MSSQFLSEPSDSRFSQAYTLSSSQPSIHSSIIKPIMVPNIEPLVKPIIEPIIGPIIEPIIDPQLPQTSVYAVIKPAIEPAINESIASMNLLSKSSIQPSMHPLSQPTMNPLNQPHRQLSSRPISIRQANHQATAASGMRVHCRRACHQASHQ